MNLLTDFSLPVDLGPAIENFQSTVTNMGSNAHSVVSDNIYKYGSDAQNAVYDYGQKTKEYLDSSLSGFDIKSSSH